MPKIMGWTRTKLTDKTITKTRFSWSQNASVVVRPKFQTTHTTAL